MRQRWILLIVVGLLLALAGCGGTPAPTPTPTSPPTPTTPPAPAFGPITFGLGIVNDEQIARPGTTFPEGIYKVYAAFDYTDMAADTEWRREWFWNGELLEGISKTEPWPQDSFGSSWLSTFNENGLSAGKWEIKLYIAGKLAQSASFEVSERRPDVPVFKPIVFAKTVTEDFDPIEPSNQFAAGVSTIHGVFETEKLANGMSFDRVWFFDGVEILRGTQTVDESAKDIFDASIFMRNGTLDPGTYTLELHYKEQLVQAGSFLITK